MPTQAVGTGVLKFSIPVPPSRGSVVRVNPIDIICSLTWKQQALFWSGWLVRLPHTPGYFCGNDFFRRGLSIVCFFTLSKFEFELSLYLLAYDFFCGEVRC